jgi:hypothetical protein
MSSTCPVSGNFGETGPSAIVRRVRRTERPLLVLLLPTFLGCGSPTSAASPPPQPEPVGVVNEPGSKCACATAASSEAPGADPAPSVQPTQSPTPAGLPTVPAAGTTSPQPIEELFEAKAVGPAQNGIRLGTHTCEFREGVDAYRRQCKVTKNPDGSLQVSAAGTELNPNNGFTFSLHGGPWEFAAKGTLDAFDFCAGPFVARAIPIVDHGVRTFELRFKTHCMIVVR